MAHMIENMAYVDEVPWHGLGVKLGDGAVDSEKMIVGAGLDWEVIKRPLSYTEEVLGDPALVPPGLVKTYKSRKFALVRKDKQEEEFAVVSDGYTPLQNRDAFKFFDTIVGQGAAIYHTAGLLTSKRIWILAKLPGTIEVQNGDCVDKYLMLSNGHDGIHGIDIRFTPIRVVCNNTLTAALASFTNLPRLKIFHSSQVDERMKAAAELLGISNRLFDATGDAYRLMAKTTVQPDAVARFRDSVFEMPVIDPATEPAKVEAIVNRVKASRTVFDSLLRGGKGVELHNDRMTAWRLYNAVTEYTDHILPPKNRKADAVRLNRMWFGDLNKMRDRAFKFCTQMAGVEIPAAETVSMN